MGRNTLVLSVGRRRRARNRMTFLPVNRLGLFLQLLALAPKRDTR